MSPAGGTLPFRQFVLKVHSRCDLACDHCYVYERADQSWRERPRLISSETVAKVADRIAEHAESHALPGVRVVLHGGEPLLAGAPRLGEIARQLRQVIDPVCPLDLRIHTNGLRLDEEYCETFLAQRVKVGISLDGDQAANDLHRRYANGASSYDRVVRAVNLLREPRFRELYAGLLCTVDVRSDPVASYRALASLDPPAIDFLLPHSTWDEPPPGSAPGRTPYADWLTAAYDTWAADPGRVRVRIFESVIRTTLGGSSLTEALGLTASDLVTVETDGSIEQADSIKVAYDGAPATGLDVFSHPFDAAAGHSAIRARQQGLAGLSATCQRCPVVSSCGGGLYAHRYQTGTGFQNPSVFCGDLEKMIMYVRARLRPAAPGPGQRQAAHQLPGEQFDALARGYGDEAALAHLVRAEQSTRRALLRLLRERVTGPGSELFRDGWRLIAALEADGGTGVVNEVLQHPYVRTWTEGILLELAQAPDVGQALPSSAGHLAAVALAAALRAGVPAELDLPVLDGHVHLPTLGRLRAGDARTVTVTTVDGGFEVRSAAAKWRIELENPEPVPGWEPVRLLRGGPLTVRLEDTDPFRDCHGWRAAPRLPDAEAAAWTSQVTVAGELIERDYPEHLPGLAGGLSTLMPLANDDSGREISAAARSAFGAVGAALPPDGAQLALLLIHEFQHVKLGALLDLFDLYEAVPGQLYYAPWRPDPRPIEPLLQGTYAHLGVTDFWRVRRGRVGGAAAAEAEELFARWRLLTAEAIGTLADSGALTGLGARFVAGLRETVEPWLAESVSPRAERAAAEWAARRRAGWEQGRGATADRYK